MDYLKIRERFKIFKPKKILEKDDAKQLSRDISDYNSDLENFLKDLVVWNEKIYEETTKRVNHSIGINEETTWNPGSINAGSYEAVEVTIEGVELGDFAIASFSLDVSDLILGVDVTATNTITCILFNPTGGAINLGEGTLRIRVYER